MILLICLLLMEDYSDLKDLANKTQTAALSTMYKEYPYTSLVPYVIDEQGRPIVFISDLAVHTKNLKKNNKCSLMACKIDKKDVFNSARITFIGKMIKVDKNEVKKVYLDKYPDAESLLDLDDFNFYRMEVEYIHYIGGFGDINWYDKTSIKEIWR